jgi:3-oxoacyl-[acyl-carrier-protein] synthase II
MKALIRGVGVVGGFGCGTMSLEKAIAGRVCAEVPAAVGERDETAPALTADTAMLARLFPPQALRRVDHHSRMAVLAGRLALDDAGGGDGLPAPMGVIVATGLGPTAGTLDSQSPEADAEEPRLSPIQFSNSVHNAAAAYISILLKVRGPNLSINHYDMSVAFAFQTAIDWLEEGRAASVLVGGLDCFSKALDEAGRAGRPLAGGNGGIRPAPIGEGSAFFVLTRPAAEESRYPLIQDARVGRPGPTEAVSPPETLVLHDGSGAGKAPGGRGGRQADFTQVYGAFPASMALDVAVAALLLKKGSSPGGLPPHTARARAFQGDPLIRCLKRGVSGDSGVIDVGR